MKKLLTGIILSTLIYSSAFATALQIDALWSGINNPSNGKSYAGAIVATFASGTTTPKAVWENKEKTLPSALGKAQFTLNSNGQAFVYGDGVYKINIYAPTDTGLTNPLITIDGATYTVPGSTVSGISLNDVYACDLADAVSDIGSITQTTLTVDCDCVIDDGTTVTSTENISINIPNGGSIDGVAGGGTETLNIEGDAKAGEYQWIGDNITVNIDPRNTTYLQWTGADPDGTTDYTEEVQRAINFAGVGGHVMVTGGIYMIDPTYDPTYATYGGLKLLDDQTIEFVGDGEFKAIVVPESQSSVVRIEGKSGIKIIKPRITGERVGHVDTGGEWGQGIYIYGVCDDILIDGGYLQQFWGDAITVGAYTLEPGITSNLRITNNTIYKAGRNGISVLGAENYTITGNTILSVDRTSPKAGIDLEPVTQYNDLGTITGNTIDDCQIGVALLTNSKNTTITGNTLRAWRGIQWSDDTEDTLVSGNTIKVMSGDTVNAGLYLNAGTGTGKLSFKGNTVSGETGSARVITTEATGNPNATVIIKNNEFYPVTEAYTSVLDDVSDGEFCGNTVITPSTFDVSNLTSDGVLQFNDADNWVIEDNKFIAKDSTFQEINIATGTVRRSSDNMFFGIATNNATLSVGLGGKYEMLLGTINVDMTVDANTTIITVPTGTRCFLTKAVIVVESDAGTTDLSIGQAASGTDFVAVYNLGNLNAAKDAAILTPIPNTTPLLGKSYGAGINIVARTTNNAGGATNTLYLYGYLY